MVAQTRSHSQATTTTEPQPARFIRGQLPIIAAATLWGTTGTAATFAPSAATGVSIGAATMGFGGLVLLALAGRSTVSVLRSGRRTLVVAIPGAVAIAVYPLAFYSSMALSGVAIGTVVSIGSSPVFAALLERVIDHVGLECRWMVATALSAAGAAILVRSAGVSTGRSVAAVVAGVALGFVAGATYAGYSFAARRLIQVGHPSRAVMGTLFGMGSVVLVPVVAVTGSTLLHSAAGVVVATYLALVPMSLAYVLFGSGLRHVGATAATTLSLIEPAVAAMLSVLVVGERLGTGSWLGVGLIGVGLVILIVRRAGDR
ncbi:MAG: DMT family transporter [Mycobacterium sp.]